MDINTKYLKVNGKIEVDRELNLQDDVQVTASVFAIEDQDNQDGTVNRVYKAKITNED